MTASKLANRIAMSQLIEFDMEEAQPEHMRPAPSVLVHFDMGIDPDLLAGDDDLDVLQSEEESSFFSQLQMNREHRSARRSFRNW